MQGGHSGSHAYSVGCYHYICIYGFPTTFKLRRGIAVPHFLFLKNQTLTVALVLGRQPKLIATMKKLFLIVAAMFAVVSFSACSDDDDKDVNPNQIIGTWQIIEIHENDSYSDEIWPTESDYYTYTFNENGTAILKWHDGSNEEYNYNYFINGNVLTMNEKNTTEPMTYIFQIKELTKSRLVLFEHEVNPDDENDVYEATLTFKKI